MRATITGVTGQDGSYLAELLLSKGYEVFGIVRRTSQDNTCNIGHLLCEDNFHVVSGDVTDQESLSQIVRQVQPDEVYHLAAQSHVGISWKQPFHTVDVTGMGTLKLLEAIRTEKPNTKVYLAGSSEIFGNRPPPQNEETPMQPASPYGVAKAMLRHLAWVYRDSYGMFVSTGILFNHESERRSPQFVTRKITQAVARIKHKQQSYLELGNLEAKRDWGYAPDYCRAMYLILQARKPDDYVIATGETHSVRDFVEAAFRSAGISDYKNYIRVDQGLIRPNEVKLLLGNSTKANQELGWFPNVPFSEMINRMVKNDLEIVRIGKDKVNLGAQLKKK